MFAGCCKQRTNYADIGITKDSPGTRKVHWSLTYFLYGRKFGETQIRADCFIIYLHPQWKYAAGSGRMISRVKHVSFYSMSMTVSLNRDGHQCPFFVPLTPVCSLHLILTSCTLIALQNVRMLHHCEPRRRMWLFEALDGGGFPIRPSMCPVAACVSVGELGGHFMGKQMSNQCG